MIIDDDVFGWVKWVVRELGFLIGFFFGLVLVVSLKVVEKLFVGVNIVIIFFDFSECYLSENIYE